MSDRDDRLKEIERIILSERVESQDALLSLLHKAGFKSTQGSLSKDMKQLGVIRKVDGKGYCYTIDRSLSTPPHGRFNDILGISFSGNIAVIRTYNGCANAVCAAIDSLKYSDILGTIAGDDTIFAVLAENADLKIFSEFLGSHFTIRGLDMH